MSEPRSPHIQRCRSPDRGGRVAYRMALDHPAVVERLAVLDIVPTGEVWSRADANFALGYWHWAFLAQPAPVPERLILGDPDAFWIPAQRQGISAGERYPDEVVSAYRAQCADPASVEAMCEDYRAGATIDRQLDDADRGRRTISCPILALWGGAGALPRFYDDPLELWRVYAPAISGHAVPGASHFLAEDAPRRGRTFGAPRCSSPSGIPLRLRENTSSPRRGCRCWWPPSDEAADAACWGRTTRAPAGCRWHYNHQRRR